MILYLHLRTKGRILYSGLTGQSVLRRLFQILLSRRAKILTLYKGFCKIEVRHTFEKKKSSFYFFFFKTKRIKPYIIMNYKANTNYF